MKKHIAGKLLWLREECKSYKACGAVSLALTCLRCVRCVRKG